MAAPHGNYDGDDDEDGGGRLKKGAIWYEFDCPSCNANNPWPDGFKAREEIICHYCGLTFLVHVTDDGRVKLKEL